MNCDLLYSTKTNFGLTLDIRYKLWAWYNSDDKVDLDREFKSNFIFLKLTLGPLVGLNISSGSDDNVDRDL